MTIYIIIGLALLVSTIFYFKSRKKDTETEPVIELTLKEQNETLSRIEVKIETANTSIETAEQTLKRLNAIVNPDKDKPFAKISSPDLSELPEKEPEVESFEEIKTKAKRTYKKRTPKDVLPITPPEDTKN